MNVFGAGSGASAVTPSQIIMYQTPQGVVYAAPTPSAALGTERTIFNFQQPAHAISIPQADGGQYDGVKRQLSICLLHDVPW